MVAKLSEENLEREFKIAHKMKINRERLEMALGLSSLTKEWQLVKKNVKGESTMFQTKA